MQLLRLVRTRVLPQCLSLTGPSTLRKGDRNERLSDRKAVCVRNVVHFETGGGYVKTRPMPKLPKRDIDAFVRESLARLGKETCEQGMSPCGRPAAWTHWPNEIEPDVGDTYPICGRCARTWWRIDDGYDDAEETLVELARDGVGYRKIRGVWRRKWPAVRRDRLPVWPDDGDLALGADDLRLTTAEVKILIAWEKATL